jgi:DNA-3-methyladenine glycosylase I
MSYCQFCENLPLDNVHRLYHDELYGFPIESDDELFGRLILEINQAGLSWQTILNKEQNFRAAFDNYNIQKIANYKDDNIAELLSNAGIVRNKLKVNSVIYNAQVAQGIINEYGSFKAWLDHHHPKNRDEWTKIFKKTFKFTGGEIVNEFLMSCGYLPGAHLESCPIFDRIINLKPNWLSI